MSKRIPSWDWAKPEVKPYTGIVLAAESLSEKVSDVWEVWYKGVQFATLPELKDAHDRLQKLLALDSTK
jgi:hypothetical protein